MRRPSTRTPNSSAAISGMIMYSPPRPRPKTPANTYIAVGDSARNSSGIAADEVRGREREKKKENPRPLQGAPPPERVAQPRRELRDERAANPDSKIREPHGLAARTIEPTREQPLIRERTATDVAQRVE